MARDARPIARVRLARSLPRVLAAPLLAIVFGAALIVMGLVLVGGTPGLAVVAGGVAVGVLGIVGAAVPLSVRVDIEESIVRVRWLFGRRVYLLTPGSLTRIHLHGEVATPLRAGFRFGWALGPAVLRNVEEIHVVRLAPTETVILIPTARGRLGIATSDEEHLIDALVRATHARARTEEIAAAEEEPEEPEPSPAAGVAPFDPRLLTGIERSQYLEALARREAEARTAAAAPPPAAEPQPTVAIEPPPAAIPAARPRRIFRRPSWARRRPSEGSLDMPAMPPPSPAALAVPSRSATVARVRALPVSRRKPSWLLPLVPLAAAGGAWAAGVYIGRMPELGSDTARLTALALVLAGPGTTIGALMARTWWPRTVGVVVTGGLAASVFIGRALLPI
ncbi:MAG: hypothetical protein LC744_01305 [Chloroflexi bacterium]|nr:hypothetical protein [Chloroflexota bacterium]